MHLRHEWNQVGESIAEHDHEANAILLKAKALVSCQQDFKPGLSHESE